MYPRKFVNVDILKMMNNGSRNADASNSFRRTRAFAKALVPLRRAGKEIKLIAKAIKPRTRIAQGKPLLCVKRSKATI